MVGGEASKRTCLGVGTEPATLFIIESAMDILGFFSSYRGNKRTAANAFVAETADMDTSETETVERTAMETRRQEPEPFFTSISDTSAELRRRRREPFFSVTNVAAPTERAARVDHAASAESEPKERRRFGVIFRSNLGSKYRSGVQRVGRTFRINRGRPVTNDIPVESEPVRNDDGSDERMDDAEPTSEPTDVEESKQAEAEESKEEENGRYDFAALDVDGLLIETVPEFLFFMNKSLFDIGKYKRAYNNMLLVSTKPGFVYIDKNFKPALNGCMDRHFGVYLEASDDECVLLKTDRRIASRDLVNYLEQIGVTSIVYIDYAQKATLDAYEWLGHLPRDIPAKIQVDIGYEEKEKASSTTFKLFRWKDLRMGEHIGHTYSICPVLQARDQFQHGTLAIIRRRGSDSKLVKGKVYLKSIHVSKATVNTVFYSKPINMQNLRRSKVYLLKIRDMMNLDRRTIGVRRTELTIEVDMWTQAPWRFFILKDFVDGLVMEKTLTTQDWFDEMSFVMQKAVADSTFAGDSKQAPTERKIDFYNIVLNSFGITGPQIKRKVGSLSVKIANLNAEFVALQSGQAASVNEVESMMVNPPVAVEVEGTQPAVEVEAIQPAETAVMEPPARSAADLHQDISTNCRIYEKMKRNKTTFSVRSRAGRLVATRDTVEELWQKVMEYGDNWREFVAEN